MNKSKLRKTSMIILFLFCALYLLRLLLGMASVFGIHTLTYQSLGWGVVLREYRFDFDNNLMEMNQYHHDGTLVVHNEAVFSPKQQQELRMACLKSLLPLWKGHYHDPGISDGDQWYLEFSYDKNGKYTSGSSGCNAYPHLYHTLYDVIMTLSSDIKTE